MIIFWEELPYGEPLQYMRRILAFYREGNKIKQQEVRVRLIIGMAADEIACHLQEGIASLRSHIGNKETLTRGELSGLAVGLVEEVEE